jgi:hypothetical protein
VQRFEKPGRPASATVGSRRQLGTLGLPTASARRRPDAACGATLPAEPNIACTSPLITAASAGAVPLYGMLTIFTPAIWLKSIAPRYPELPGPPTEKFISPGLALASAMSCLTVCSGIDGCTTSTLGARSISVIGAKSLIGS